MAENLKEIKGQISSVANLKKITRAMEMVARSKMKRAVDHAVSSRPYSDRMLALLHTLGPEEGKNTNPLLSTGKGETVLILHIASEKGLCGGYNAQALRSLRILTRTWKSKESIHAISLGKYALRHVEKLGLFHLQNFTIGEHIEVSKAKEIAEFVLSRFLSGSYSSVYISYANFKTIFSHEQVTRKLLPISKESIVAIANAAGAGEDEVVAGEDSFESLSKEEIMYRFEPSREVVLESILPGLITTMIYQALLEAAASEQSSRMVAMKSATDNATKFGGELTLKYNRARQASITREIIEIAAGADAV